jgi:hypothetical protein
VIHARNRCVCFGHIENVGKQALEQSGKYPVNEIDEEIFRRAGKRRLPWLPAC